MESSYARKLDGTCWWGKIDNIVRSYTFHYEPTFFQKGGVFKLSYLDQCTRYAPDVAYSNQPNGILLYGSFSGVEWKAKYTGGDLLTWINDANKNMTWELTHCDI